MVRWFTLKKVNSRTMSVTEYQYLGLNSEVQGTNLNIVGGAMALGNNYYYHLQAERTLGTRVHTVDRVNYREYDSLPLLAISEYI